MNINKIENDNKVNVFLALIDASAFELLVSLVTPDDVAGKSYNDLTKLLEDYYKPKHSVVGERYTFSSCNQQENESVTDFILALKKLSINFEFGDSLKNTLRDRLLIGVQSPAIKTRLFSLTTTTDLTWDKACSEAQAMELAHNETKSCQSTPVVTQNVNRITKMWSDSPKSKQNKWSDSQKSRQKNANKQRKTCYRCNGQHNPDSCYAKTWSCHKCSKIGHILKACKSSRYQRYSSNTHQVGDSVNTVQ